MRKQKDFDMMDRIEIKLCCDANAIAAFETHRSYIMKETLADSLVYRAERLEEFKLNGHTTGISVEKISE